VSSAWQWPSPLTIEKDLKPTISSYGMDEAESQNDAALSLSDGGPLRRVRDPGGLESEGGSILRGRSPHMSQISDSQASTEFSIVTAQGQTVLSQSESESAITYPVSAAAADLSLASLPGDEVQPKVPASVSTVLTASVAMPTVSSVTGSLASSLAPVGGVTSMLSVRESRSAAELERMHTGFGALSYAVEFVERADASFV